MWASIPVAMFTLISEKWGQWGARQQTANRSKWGAVERGRGAHFTRRSRAGSKIEQIQKEQKRGTGQSLARREERTVTG